MNPQVWWYLTRASGLVAWGLSTASIMWGLALVSKAFAKKPKPAWLLNLHRYLGGLTVAFVGLHLAALVADSYVHFGVADVLVPLASGWRPLAVAWGIIAFWLLVAVEATSLLKKWLPRRLWRAVHVSSYLVWVTATVHAVTAGSDATHPAFVTASIGSVGSAAFLSLYRELRPRRAPVRPATTAARGTLTA